MAQNNYIISEHGFLVDIHKKSSKDDVERYNWTKNIREAGLFSGKQASTIIECSNVGCFVWNPFKHNVSQEKYEVVRRTNYRDFMNDVNHEVLEWYASKAYVDNTDLSFMHDTYLGVSKKFYTFEKATEIAKERNEKILKEITEILNKK